MTTTFVSNNPTQTTIEKALLKNVQKTSIEAYYSIKNLGDRHKVILWCIRKFPDRTDQELTKLLGKTDPNYVRPRRFELEHDFGLIECSGSRECSVTHKTALTWKVTEKGRVELK